MRSEEQLREALKQFGEIEAVTLRRKEGDCSWAFVVFVSQADAHKAQAAGTVTKVTVDGEGKKQERELKLEPVALKRELHAERRHLDNPTGVLVRHATACARLVPVGCTPDADGAAAPGRCLAQDGAEDLARQAAQPSAHQAGAEDLR